MDNIETVSVTHSRKGSMKSGECIIDPAIERRVVRKIDKYVLPFIGMTVLLTFLDKAMLGYAAVFDLKKDLHLHGNQYSWVSSIFYFGFMVFEYISCFVMQKTSVPKWLSLNIFLWGGITMAFGGGHNFETMMVLRFLLGVLESCANPGFLIITSMWYTREEQPIRIGYWAICGGLSHSFGGLFAYGVGHIQGALGDSWRYQFIVIGAISSAWGLFMFFALADDSQRAGWLTEEEKLVAKERHREDQMGPKKKEVKVYQIVEAFTDAKTWMFFGMAVSAMIVNGFTSNFGSLAVQGFGYPAFETLLLQIPYGVVILISTVSGGHLQDWLPGEKRCVVAVSFLVPAIIGASGMYALPRTSPLPLLICYYMVAFSAAAYASIQSMLIANVAGSTKQTTVNAIFFIAYCTGNITGPMLFLEREAPKYSSGLIAVVAAFCVEASLVAAFGVYARHLNQKKKTTLAELQAAGKSREEEREQTAFRDLTDLENPFFEYRY